VIHRARVFARKQSNGEQTMILMVVADGCLDSLTDEALHDCTVLEVDGTLTISVDAAEVTGDFYGLRADQVLVSHTFSRPLETIREGEEHVRQMAKER